MTARAKSERKFITFPQLCERWGGAAAMTLELRMRKDKTFPRVYWMGGRVRLFDVEEVEQYERDSIVKRRRDEVA